jgi:hypothetical protein
MDNDPEFISYKKLLIFNSGDSGKTTLTEFFKKGFNFESETHTENGKLK